MAHPQQKNSRREERKMFSRRPDSQIFPFQTSTTSFASLSRLLACTPRRLSSLLKDGRTRPCSPPPSPHGRTQRWHPWEWLGSCRLPTPAPRLVTRNIWWFWFLSGTSPTSKRTSWGGGSPLPLTLQAPMTGALPASIPTPGVQGRGKPHRDLLSCKDLRQDARRRAGSRVRASAGGDRKKMHKNVKVHASVLASTNHPSSKSKSGRTKNVKSRGRRAGASAAASAELKPPSMFSIPHTPKIMAELHAVS